MIKMPYGVTSYAGGDLSASGGRTLPSLAAGDAGVIERINTRQRAVKRLADMGFVRGVKLEMIRPGKPCIVRIGGACVGLGAAYQAAIQLTPSDS